MSLFTYRDFCCDKPLAISSPLGSSDNISSIETLHAASPKDDISDEEIHQSGRLTDAAGTLPIGSRWSLFHPSVDSLDLAVRPSPGLPGCSSWDTPSTSASERHRLNDTILSDSSGEFSTGERQPDWIPKVQFLPPRPTLEQPPPPPPPVKPAVLPAPMSTPSAQQLLPPPSRPPAPPPPPPHSPARPPDPDFVNSLITVSAETLWRVYSAGGNPWRWLPPAAVGPAEQLTRLRAVVPLRRLGASELRRWLGPKERCRSAARPANTSSLPSTAEAQARIGRSVSSNTVTESSMLLDGTPTARRRLSNFVTESPMDRSPKVGSRPRVTKSLSPAVVNRTPAFPTERSAGRLSTSMMLPPQVEAHLPAVKNRSSDAGTLPPVVAARTPASKGSLRSAEPLSAAAVGHVAKSGSIGCTPQPPALAPRVPTALTGRSKSSKPRLEADGSPAVKSGSLSTRRPGRLSLSGSCCKLSVVSHEAAKAAARAVLRPSERHRHRGRDDPESDSRSSAKRRQSPTSVGGGSERKVSRPALVLGDGGGKKSADQEAERLSQRPGHSAEAPVPGRHLGSTSLTAATTATVMEATKEAVLKQTKGKESKRFTKQQMTLISLFDPPDRLSLNKVRVHSPACKPSGKKSSSPPLTSQTQQLSERPVQSDLRRPERRPAADTGSARGGDRSAESSKHSHDRRQSSQKRKSTGGDAAALACQLKSQGEGGQPSTTLQREVVVPKKMLKLGWTAGGANTRVAAGPVTANEVASDASDQNPPPTHAPAPASAPAPVSALAPAPALAEAPAPASTQAMTAIPVPAETPAETRAPTPAKTTTSGPGTIPAPTPGPDTAPAQTPGSDTTPAPTPGLDTIPAPTPGPASAPVPTPGPAPAPPPDPDTAPVPALGPGMALAPTPGPTPAPIPDPDTALALTPGPGTALAPTPGPALAPTPGPDTALAPTPGPDTALALTPGPGTALAPTPGPGTAPTPGPGTASAPRQAGRRPSRPLGSGGGASDAAREAAARRAARRPILAPGASPPPPPPAVFPGRIHESSDEDDSLDLSAEIRDLQDKYQSSSDEQADSDGAGGAREPGSGRRHRGTAPGSTPRGGAMSDSSADSAEPRSGHNSGGEELSIFMEESDMEWDEGGPSAPAARASRDSGRLALTAGVRRSVQPPAEQTAVRKHTRPPQDIPSLAEGGWPPQRPKEPALGSQRTWPPQQPRTESTLGLGLESSWPPQQPKREPPISGCDGVWPPQGAMQEQLYCSEGAWPPQEPLNGPSSGGAWPPQGLLNGPNLGGAWPPQGLFSEPSSGGAWPRQKPKRGPGSGSKGAWPPQKPKKRPAPRSLQRPKKGQASTLGIPLLLPRPCFDMQPSSRIDSMSAPAASQNVSWPQQEPAPAAGAPLPPPRSWDELPFAQTARQRREGLPAAPTGIPPHTRPRTELSLVLAPRAPLLPTPRLDGRTAPAGHALLPTPRPELIPPAAAAWKPPRTNSAERPPAPAAAQKPSSPRDERPSSPTTARPDESKEKVAPSGRQDCQGLEEGEITPEDDPLPDDSPAGDVPQDGSGDGVPPLMARVKSEEPYDEGQDVKPLSGYRHFSGPDFCPAFLQLLPCCCPPQDATHKLPPVCLLRACLVQLAAAGRHEAALQLVRAARHRSQHEPGPPLAADSLAPLYDVVVQACVRAGEPVAALCLIGDLRNCGIRSPDVFHNIIQAQSAGPSLAGPLSDLVSALRAGFVQLHPATRRLLLQLCVHSDAAQATWQTLANMMESGSAPSPRLLERALRLAASSPELLGRSGWLVARHVELITAVRPDCREIYVSQLRRRGLLPQADAIEEQLAVRRRPLVPLGAGFVRPPRSLQGRGRPAGRTQPPPLGCPRMPEGVLVAIPQPAVPLVRSESPQFSPAESEGRSSEPAPSPSPPSAEPPQGDGDTPQSPAGPESEPPAQQPSSPVRVKSEASSANPESPPPVSSPGDGPNRPADRGQLARLMAEMEEDEHVSLHSEPALRIPRDEVAAAGRSRAESVPILPRQLRLGFEFEPPPGRAAAAAGSGGPGPAGGPGSGPGRPDWPGVESAPDQLQLLNIRRRLERLKGPTGPTVGAVTAVRPAGSLAAAVREAAAATDTAQALGQVLAELASQPEQEADLFKALCAELTAAGGGWLPLPELRAVHTLGAAVLLRARSAADWPAAYSVASTLIACRVRLEAAVQPIGQMRCSPFQLCLAILEVLLRTGRVMSAFRFADGYNFFPTSSEPQLASLLPVMGELQRRLALQGFTVTAFRLLRWIIDRVNGNKTRSTAKDNKKRPAVTNWRLFIDIPQLVNGMLLSALTTGAADLALRVHTLAMSEHIQLSADCLRQTLQLRLRLKHHCLARQLYHAGCQIGVYPQQQVFTPLMVQLPCWLSQEEMQLALDEFARAVVAAFGGVPPVQHLSILLTADSRPPALLLEPISVRPEDAAIRLQQACALMTPPLRLQPGHGPQFIVTAESLADKLITQAASSRVLAPASAPGLVRVWDAPPGELAAGR